MTDTARSAAPCRRVGMVWLLATASVLPLFAGHVHAQATSVAGPFVQAGYLCSPTNHMAPVDAADAHHVLNRITFGPTTTDLAQVQNGANGYTNYIVSQLNAWSIPENPDLGPALAQLSLPSDIQGTFSGSLEPLSSLDEIRKARVLLATHSRRQLNEVMTEFWENHFNTDFNQLGNYINELFDPDPSDAERRHMQALLEWKQNEMFRTYALTNFEQLVRRVIKSPAMMIYLNNVQNNKCTGNENFFRELCELYCMGVFNESVGTANYEQNDLQNDIKEGTRAQSGTEIQIVNNQFVWAEEANEHCADEKRLFSIQGLIDPGNELVIPMGGTFDQDNDLLVNHIVQLDATKDFICRKLIRQFVGDAAAEGGTEQVLLNSMKAVWGANGNIRAVLCELFGSEVFQGATYRWQRVRSPLEVIAWHARIWDGTPESFLPNLQAVPTAAAVFQPERDVLDLGMDLFTYPPPIGYPLASIERLGSTRTIESAIAGSDIYRSVYPALQPTPPQVPLPWLVWFYGPTPWFLFTIAGAASSDEVAVAAQLLDRMYPGITTTVDRDQVVAALGTLDPPISLENYLSALTKAVAMAQSFTYATLK